MLNSEDLGLAGERGCPAGTGTDDLRAEGKTYE